MQDQVYTDDAELPSQNGQAQPGKSGKSCRTANVPEDPVVDALLEERIVGYHPLLSRALKLSEDVPKRMRDRQLERAAILLSNLLYWTPKSSAAGWIYKERDVIEEETDLSRRAQEGARELLREAGVLEERLKRGRLYFRIRWGGLKPLLRLAIEDRHVVPAAQDRHVEPGARTDMSSAVKDRHVEPTSVSTTQEEHPVHVQSSSACAHGSGMPASSPGMDDGGMDEGEVSKEASTMPLSQLETPGKSGTKGPGRRSRPGSRRTSRGFGTLAESILEDALALPALDLSGEAASLGRQLCRDLGRLYAPEGLAVRLAEECIRRGLPEALGVVAAKASRDDVRSPDGYLRTYIAGEINERKDHMQPGGDPVARFRAARDGELTRLIAASMVRGGKSSGGAGRPWEDGPAQDAEGRQSLTGRSALPIYGVGDPALERDPEDYFVRSDRRGRAE